MLLLAWTVRFDTDDWAGSGLVGAVGRIFGAIKILDETVNSLGKVKSTQFASGRASGPTETRVLLLLLLLLLLL